MHGNAVLETQGGRWHDRAREPQAPTAPVHQRTERGPSGHWARAQTAPRTDAFRQARERAERRRSHAAIATHAAARAGRVEATIDGITERLRKGRYHYLTGKAEYEAGAVIRAATSLALAVSCEPGNEQYELLLRFVRARADEVAAARRLKKAAGLVVAGEHAESMDRARQAQGMYTQAIEHGSTNPQAFFRLAILTRRHDGELRTALKLLRRATALQPDTLEYMTELASLYDELGFTINARGQRERIQRLSRRSRQAGAC